MKYSRRNKNIHLGDYFGKIFEFHDALCVASVYAL